MSMQQYPFSPRTEFTEAELAAFLERERFLKERERALQRAMIEGRPIESVDAPQPAQEQPAPSTPVEQPEPEPQQQSRLGLTVPLTDQDIMLEAYRVAEQQAQENLESTLPQDILERRQQATVERMLNRSVTPEGTDIGTFGESDLLLHTDGYVVGEDGKPRKASGAEILMQGFGRQALYRGAEYDKRLAEINATREMKLAELKAQGMSDIEARENVDAWYSGQLTEVDKQNRDIRETWLASIMRQMGLGSAALEEVVFDEMPLFYEVDEQGNPTNLDSWADSLAYTLDTARKAGSEAAGVDLAEWGRSGMATAVRANPLTAGPAAISDAILRGYGKSLPDLMPVPYSPIDREAQTTSAERGRRAAANTGGFAGDVGMAWARGRFFHDGLMSIPSYRNQLGDAQWVSLIPAMGVEIGLPGGPLDIGFRSVRGARLLAKTGVLGKTLQAAADIGNAAQWEASHRLVAEMGEMIDDTGKLDVATMAATHGDPARVVAANTAREMATPFKLQALARDEMTTVAELEGAARTSEVGRHILNRVHDTGVMAPARNDVSIDEMRRVGEAIGDGSLEAITSAGFSRIKSAAFKSEQYPDVIVKIKGGAEADIAARYPDIAPKAIRSGSSVIMEKVTPLDALDSKELSQVFDQAFSPKVASVFKQLIGDGEIDAAVRLAQALRLRTAASMEEVADVLRTEGEDIVGLVETLSTDPWFNRVSAIAREEQLLYTDIFRLDNLGVDRAGRIKLIDLEADPGLDPFSVVPNKILALRGKPTRKPVDPDIAERLKRLRSTDPDFWNEPGNVLYAESGRLTRDQRAAIDLAVMEWRLGVEARTIERELMAGGVLAKTSEQALDNAVLNTVGKRGHGALHMSDLYEEARALAKQGASARDVATAYRRAAQIAGSAPVRSDHRIMRMLLSLSDETAAVGARNAFNVVHPLAANMGAVKDLPLPSPGLRYGAGLERAWRHTLNEVVDAHMPRNVRFVTDRLMVPVAKLTEANYREVGAMERALYNPTFEDGVYKLPANADPNAIMGRVLSVLPGAVGKRPELVDPIRNALFDGALDVKQHAFVSDALKEAGWRNLLGDVATTPTMASRQTERAVARQRFKADVLDPTIDTVHAMVRLAATGPTKAMHALFAAMPESVVSRKILGTLRRYNEAWDQRLVSKWLVTGNPQRPQALQRTTELIANDVALVQRQYRQELRAAVAAARREGAEVPGAAALDAMAKRRWNRVARSAVDDFYRDVDRLAQASRENALKEPMRREPTKMEFIALTLYRTGRARAVNIGKLLEDLRAMGPDKQAKFVEMAESMVARDAYMQQWRNIMRDFFTRSASRKSPATLDLLKKIDQQLEAAVQADQAGADAVKALKGAAENMDADDLLGMLDDVAKSVMLEPSPTNIQTVIDRLRKALPVGLKGRGAGVGNPLTGYRDASLETGQLWQMSVDEQFAIAARVQDLVNTNPELLVRLTPSINEMTSVSVAARQLEYQAPVATTKQVVRGLAIMAEDAGVTINEGLYNAAIRQLSTAGGAMAEAVGAMPGINKNGIINSVVRYARNRIKTLSNKERLAMAQESLSAMMQRKTLYPGATGLQTIQAGGTAGKKDVAFTHAYQIVNRVIEGRRHPDAASKFMADTIGQMLGSGVARGNIERKIANEMMSALDEVFGSYVENEVRNTMRRWGFSSFSAPGSLERIAQTLIETPVDKAYAFTPVPGMEDIFEKLHSYAANGRLLPLLDSLHGRTMLKEEAYGEYLWSLLGDFVEAGRQTSAYGLLSGGLVLGGPIGFVPVMLPLFRYIGLNLLTASGMMVGTLGVDRATKALGYAAAEVGRGLGDVGRKVASKLRGRSALVNTVAPDAPDSIVFRDVYGKQWTRREFDELCEMWNSYMSRAEVDQTYNVLRTMQRELGVVAKRAGDSADLKKAHWFRQATRFVNPFFESPGMQFAVYTDTVFRRGAFASAIRDGHTPAQAAEIAKASVLDYGAIPDLVKTTANKYLLFATFRAASMKEILQSVFAGRDEWMRVMRVQMQLHKAAETWTFGADHDRVRAFTIPGPEFDYRPTAIAGPQEVFASGAADIVQASFFAAAVAAAAMDDEGESSAGDILGRLVEGIEEENIQPFAQMLIAMVVNKRPTSRGRLVNDVWVSALQSAGLWDWAVKRYEIKDINPTFHAGEMRPGAPTFNGAQFVFTGNGYRQFQVDTFAATNLMFNRSTQDIYKSLAGSPYPAGEGYDPKYRAIVPYYFYLPGLATPIRLKSPEDIYQRALNQDIYR